MYFQYDNSGTPLGFIYNGVQYFYLTNTMGDVLGITDANGTLLAQYAYDDWGKLVSIDTADEEASTAYREIAEANPLRYRGYYYDNETGYYYLQSRYYDPTICRFINADTYEYIDNKEQFGYNLFAYCGNNPINFSDPTGHKTEEDTRPMAVVQAILSAILFDGIYDFFKLINIDLIVVMNKSIKNGFYDLFQNAMMIIAATWTSIYSELTNYFSFDFIMDIFSNGLGVLINHTKEITEQAKGVAFKSVASILAALISFTDSIGNAGKQVFSKTADIVIAIVNLAIDIGTMFIKYPILDVLANQASKIVVKVIAMLNMGVVIC